MKNLIGCGRSCGSGCILGCIRVLEREDGVPTGIFIEGIKIADTLKVLNDVGLVLKHVTIDLGTDLGEFVPTLEVIYRED